MPRSTFNSPQELVNASILKLYAFSGNLVIKLITPPIASDPYSVDAGPFITSICLIKDCGIPESPYTEDNPLTNGRPSINIIVLAPSCPFI